MGWKVICKLLRRWRKGYGNDSTMLGNSERKWEVGGKWGKEGGSRKTGLLMGDNSVFDSFMYDCCSSSREKGMRQAGEDAYDLYVLLCVQTLVQLKGSLMILRFQLEIPTRFYWCLFFEPAVSYLQVD